MDLDVFSSIEPFDPEKENLHFSSDLSSLPTSSSITDEPFLSNLDSVNDHAK